MFGRNFMRQDIYITNIHFIFECDEALPLKKTDLEFVRKVIPVERTVNVSIKFVQNFSETFSIEDHFSEAIGECRRNDQPREYYAVFLPGRPAFMHSYKKENSIEIEYLTNSGVWNNPNFAIWNHLYLEELLLEQNAFLLHACYTEMNGKAILFTAPSGTGKTTQAEFWKNLYGSRIINGDLTVVQKREGIWYACGFPHHGSAEECSNETYPLEAILILRQGKKNEIRKLSAFEKIETVYSETIINRHRQLDAFAALDLIGQLIESSSVKAEMEYCEFSPSAAEYAYDFLFNT